VTVIVNAKDLASLASVAAKVASPKTTVPILSSVRLASDGFAITAEGYDHETHVITRANAEGEMPPTCVDAALMARLTGRLSGDVKLTLDEVNRTLIMKGGRSEHRLFTMPVDTYPHLPPTPGRVGESDWFTTAVSLVKSSAAPPDHPTPQLSTIRVNASGETLTLEATDRYRVSRAELPWTGGDIAANVPAERLSDFSKTFDGPVILGYNGAFLSIGNSSRTVTTLLADGADLVLGRFFTQDFKGGSFTAAREELLGAIRDVMETVEKNRPALFTFTSDVITVRSEGNQRGTSTAEIEGDYDGDDLEIKFSPRYLADAVSSLVDPWVRIDFTTPFRPARIAGLTEPGVEPKTAIQHVVMPFRDN
jgi:DNA polymerase-3 subunit beta